MLMRKMVAQTIVTAAAVLAIGCSAGGLSGEYTNKEGTVSYRFKGGKVEISTKMFGNEVQSDRAYEVSEGKLKLWEPSKPSEKQVVTIDPKGCFDAGMFAGLVCPKDSWKS